MSAYLFAIFAILCWSFNVVIASSLIDTLTPWQISTLRWGIPSIIILPFVFNILKRNIKVLLKYKFWLLWTALWGITISNTCVYFAAYTVKPVTLSLIGATGPLFLIFFAWVLMGERLLVRQFIGLLITLAGVGLIVLHGRAKSLGIGNIQVGDWWMLGTAITFGYYSYRVANKPKDLPYLPFLYISIIIGTIMCLPFFIYDTINNPFDYSTNFTPKIIWIMLFLGIFNSLLAYLAWNRALEKGDTVRIGMIYYLMPVFSSLESWLILSEPLEWIHLIGACVILCGILLTNKKTKVQT